MKRPTVLILVCLSCFLAIFPLTLDKPGWPPGMKADEPAYYLMAQSLAHDRDMRLEKRDVARLAHDFPLIPVRNLVLMTDDGWQTAYYGKPFVYPLFAAPFVFLRGADGMLCFNMLLMLLMIWLGYFYLRCFNPDWLAALTSVGFFLLSTAFAYVFWLQAEIFNMAAVTGSLFLAFYPFADRDPRWHSPRGARHWLRPLLPVFSGAVLALAAYNKPMLAALALAPLVRSVRRKHWASAGLWLGGFALCMASLAGFSTLMTGHPDAYLGVRRAGITVCSLDTLPTSALRQEVLAEAAARSRGKETEPPRPRSWEWMFRLPKVDPAWLCQNLAYFLWGRHTGLFLYLPFSLFAGIFFLINDRRSWEGWALLLSLAAVALSFIIWIPFNWQGGGGFVGNRYFVSAYPAFLFLMSRLRPARLLPVAYAVAGMLVGPIFFTPLGDVVPEGTLQAHVRNFPFPYFPLELSLKNVPGYDTVVGGGGVRFEGRKDVFLPHGEQLWLRGASRVEVWISAPKPLHQLVFDVTTAAAANRVELELGKTAETLSFGATTGNGTARVTLYPDGPDKVRHLEAGPLYYYRLWVHPETGRIEPFTRYYPPAECPNFAYNKSENDSFFLGATLTYLGDGRELSADVFHASWKSCTAPESVTAKAHFTVRSVLTNTSRAPWRIDSPVQVKLAYHWLDTAGQAVVYDGLRTTLPRPVAPGSTVELDQAVEAPDTPGLYTLQLDPLLEHVSWFSQRDPQNACLAKVQVLAAASATSASTRR